MALTGIDISSNNPGYRALDTQGLDFCVVKLTQGTGYINPLANEQLAWARSWAKHVGVYHWVEPQVAATDQAHHFIDTAHADGPFDFWALDCEDGHPASPAQWVASVNTILSMCKSALGQSGSIYVGRFFLGGALVPLARQNNWWLPDYASNNGSQHVLASGVDPVIHQYSSAGGLDHNVVLDEPAFYRMVGASSPTPTPQPAPHPTQEQEMHIGYALGSTADYIIGAGTKFHITSVPLYNEWVKTLQAMYPSNPKAGDKLVHTVDYINSLVEVH